jgi:hypothetical protein
MATAVAHLKNQIYTVRDGSLLFFLHKGQRAALECMARIVAVIAGTQSGKTVFGPVWLLHEIIRCGPGEYGVVSPTFSLMEKKALKEFLKLFEKTLKLGSYHKGDRQFYFNEEGLLYLFGRSDVECTVIFGYAENPDSLESMTLIAVWCDEAGQKQFKADSFDALMRRLAVAGGEGFGRMLITTTPYDLGWLKVRIYDRWRKGDPEIGVIQFKSTENPAFSKEEYKRAEKRMQRWKFEQFYNAKFTRPATAIYDIFNENFHVVKAFNIPKHWKKLWGIDFGQVNMAAVKIAINPDYDPEGPREEWNRKYYIYETYKPAQKTPKEHVGSLKKQGDALADPIAVGGAPSEDEWRDEFAKAGLVIHRPMIVSVEVGIDKVYALFAEGELAVMDSCERLIQDINDYQREPDAEGEATDKIQAKSTWHRLDALRYGGSELAVNPTIIHGITVIDTYQDEEDHDY